MKNGKKMGKQCNKSNKKVLKVENFEKKGFDKLLDELNEASVALAYFVLKFLEE
jgi:hypothetical protein